MENDRYDMDSEVLNNFIDDTSIINYHQNQSNNLIVFPQVEFDAPHETDGPDIWRLVKDTDNLDLNSAYSYLMLCKYFPDTCVVARYGNKITGFVSAFRPPNRPGIIFVWQVAVARSRRSKGLGTALLKKLLERDACADISFLETTITPSNIPSQSLFRKLAREFDTHCIVSECFSKELFPLDSHEKELMFTIGPIESKSTNNKESEALFYAKL